MIADCLVFHIINTATDGRSRAGLVQAWVELEAFKREMRGIPRLAVHRLKEINDARLANAKRLTLDPTSTFTELDHTDEPSKESLSPAQTVTAPPAPKTP